VAWSNRWRLEIGLNEHLGPRGITAVETDLAELIVQLGRLATTSGARDPPHPRRDPRPFSVKCLTSVS
jgi:hypothetical protein